MAKKEKPANWLDDKQAKKIYEKFGMRLPKQEKKKLDKVQKKSVPQNTIEEVDEQSFWEKNRTYVISILSDQLIPNVLFIKQFKMQKEKHVFLSTQHMELKNKSETLAKTLNLKQKDYRTILIDQNSPSKILQQLSKSIKDIESASFVVNITGGTKMMSQMTHDFFIKFSNSKIYYWPIGEGYVEQLHPCFESIEFPESKLNLDLRTYFAAYGYSIIYSKNLEKKFSEAESMMRQILICGDSALVPNIIKASNINYKANDKGYYTGGWYEEWLYHTIKTALNLGDKHIGFNVKIKNHKSEKNTDSDNEIDVAFVYNNSLYIIECKVYNKNKNLGRSITEAIYKISSIRHSLGLRATAMVALATDFGENEERYISISDTKRLANVHEVFSLKDFENKNKFIERIKSIVNYE